MRQDASDTNYSSAVIVYVMFLVCVVNVNNYKYKPARRPPWGHREVHTVEEIAREYTIANCFTTLLCG